MNGKEPANLAKPCIFADVADPSGLLGTLAKGLLADAVSVDLAT